MKKLVISFWILFAVFLIAWRIFGFYVYKVAVFEVLTEPLLWLWICSLILAAVFSVSLIIKEFNKNKHDDY